MTLCFDGTLPYGITCGSVSSAPNGDEAHFIFIPAITRVRNPNPPIQLVQTPFGIPWPFGGAILMARDTVPTVSFLMPVRCVYVRYRYVLGASAIV